jgi:UDP-glucose 4-epimerase
MNILVTGAAGFIAKAWIRALGQTSHAVFGLDNKEDGELLREPSLKRFFRQDLTKPFRLDIPFDYVFHLGALNVTHVGKAEYQAYHRVNVTGTENLIKAVNARKFVFMSTTKVYQKREGIIDEDSPLKPAGDYERSKLEAEETCRRYFKDRDLTIFRSVNVVGPGQAEKAVIPVFFKRAVHNEPLDILYSIHTPLQMLYVEDLLRAFDLLLEKDQGLGVVNLCREETITLGELAKEIVVMCHSRSPIRFDSDEAVAVAKVVSQKARTVLEWQAQVSIKDILKKYYEFICVNK